MEPIIDPIPVELIKSELTPDKKLCDTNKAGNEIYIVNFHNAPNVLYEIGRLRELSFRQAGGCSGKSMDIDDFDTMEKPYQQIVVWDPDAEKIIGGYRYIIGTEVNIDSKGQPVIATAELFEYSEHFIKHYLKHTLELGRSFVVPEYQSSKAGAKAIYALDNLWDGIGAVMMRHTQCFYFLGKMTIHPNYDQCCCDLILRFLYKHFPDNEGLAKPYEPLYPVTDTRLLDMILCEKEFKQDYRILKYAIRQLGNSIPPLVNTYINTSPTIKMLGCAKCHDLIGAQEMGIFVCFNEMYEDKRDRHIDPFLRNMENKATNRFPAISSRFLEKFRERKWHRRMKAFNSFMKKREESQ